MMKREQLKVSIIIPYYNVDEWLQETLDSIKRQTFPDYEVIIVDDGSKPSLDASRFSLSANTRVIRIEHRGTAAARNAGSR